MTAHETLKSLGCALVPEAIVTPLAERLALDPDATERLRAQVRAGIRGDTLLAWIARERPRATTARELYRRMPAEFKP